MKFRPCIDLHDGRVKQIVGSTLSDRPDHSLQTNFISDHPPSWFAEKYRHDKAQGGHIIRLGQGNDDAATQALTSWPGGMQLGGGITDQNALEWLQRGASAVIVTSHVFEKGSVHIERLQKLCELIGKDKLVLDLSCRKQKGQYKIVTNRWQNFTEVEVSTSSLDFFSEYCCEFLVHAVDVEGKCEGIEEDLVQLLGNWAKIPITYAGGIRNMTDIESIQKLGNQEIDYTVGSALDIFGGSGLKYTDLIKYNADNRPL